MTKIIPNYIEEMPASQLKGGIKRAEKNRKNISDAILKLIDIFNMDSAAMRALLDEGSRQAHRVDQYKTALRNKPFLHGCRDHEECYHEWWVFSAKKSDEDIRNQMEYETNTEGHYNGPGQPFKHPISLNRAGSRVLVTQYGGLDI